MNEINKLHKDIARKETDIEALKKQLEKMMAEVKDFQIRIDKENSYLEGLRSASKYFQRPPQAQETPREIVMKEGSELFHVRELLREHGKPMHIDDIIKSLAKDKDLDPQESRNKKLSLAGSLSSYVRKAAIFTKPKPNTFGLKEFSQQSSSKTINTSEDLKEDNTL